MKHLARSTGLLVLLTALVLVAVPVPTAQAEPDGNACWGQATQVFARLSGGLGDHSSSQATPRLGLRNLARALYDQGVIEDDTLQALGKFVSEELGLSISACM